jgi:glycosyltransferase involved in cell wall biosynthesis
MITTFYPPHAFGGDGRFVRDLSEALADRGHEVDVVYLRDAYRARSAEPTGWRPRLPPGLRVHGLKSRAGRLALVAAHQTGFPWPVARTLERHLGRTDFDVVHFHNISLFGPAVLRYGRGVKLLTLHEHWLLCEAHTLFRMNAAPCERPACVRCALTYGRPPQWWRRTQMVPHALAHVDRVIAPSRAILDRHRAAGLDARFVHLPHFVVDPLGTLPPAPALPSTPFFLFAGRLEKLKGAHTLVPLVRRHPALRLVIAGSGRYEAELRRLAGDCDRIHFTGTLSHDEMRAAYARACGVIVPSLTYEAFGLVAAEAMAAGTPVVARRLGSLAELADEGGALSYTTDDELVGHLHRLIARPDERARLGASGRAAYEQLWTVDTHLSQYLALVDEVRREKTRRSAAAAGVSTAETRAS